MEDCLFCKIIEGKIPSTKVMETENVVAFKDINPVAPIHILVVPKIHITSMNGINSENSSYIAKVYEMIAIIAKNEKIDESGYRVICNCGNDAWQAVPHLHFHLIGGKNLGAKIIKDEK